MLFRSKAQLLKGFKSVKAVKGASLEELAAVVPQNTAQAVYRHFHPAENQEGKDETP